jgi:hypothetical protein
MVCTLNGVDLDLTGQTQRTISPAFWLPGDLKSLIRSMISCSVPDREESFFPLPLNTGRDEHRILKHLDTFPILYAFFRYDVFNTVHLCLVGVNVQDRACTVLSETPVTMGDVHMDAIMLSYPRIRAGGIPTGIDWVFISHAGPPGIGVGHVFHMDILEWHKWTKEHIFLAVSEEIQHCVRDAGGEKLAILSVSSSGHRISIATMESGDIRSVNTEILDAHEVSQPLLLSSAIVWSQWERTHIVFISCSGYLVVVHTDTLGVRYRQKILDRIEYKIPDESISIHATENADSLLQIHIVHTGRIYGLVLDTEEGQQVYPEHSFYSLDLPQ